MTNHHTLVTAANTLVTSENADTLYSQLLAIAKIDETLPFTLTGEAAQLEPLLPLLPLLRTDRPRFDAVLDLVNTKREARGLARLGDESEKRFSKVVYQKGFMGIKRALQKRAVILENARRPKRDRLIGNARLEFEKAQSRKWLARRDAFLEKVKQQGPMPVGAYHENIALFWKSIDVEVAAAEAEARLKRG